MAPVPAPGIISLEAVWIAGTEPVENTFHYRFAGTINEALLLAMATTYSTWATAHTILFSSDCLLTKIRVADLTTSSSAVEEFNRIPPLAGTNASPALPNNATWALSRRTGKRGRANRGRIYQIGMTDADLVAGGQAIGVPSASARVTAYQALSDQQFSDNAVTEVLLHRKLGTGTDITGYGFSDLFMDSQRRRLPGHNRHH